MCDEELKHRLRKLEFAIHNISLTPMYANIRDDIKNILKTFKSRKLRNRRWRDRHDEERRRCIRRYI